MKRHIKNHAPMRLTFPEQLSRAFVGVGSSAGHRHDSRTARPRTDPGAEPFETKIMLESLPLHTNQKE
jgi:hypothetical protein